MRISDSVFFSFSFQPSTVTCFEKTAASHHAVLHAHQPAATNAGQMWHLSPASTAPKKGMPPPGFNHPRLSHPDQSSSSQASLLENLLSKNSKPAPSAVSALQSPRPGTLKQQCSELSPNDELAALLAMPSHTSSTPGTHHSKASASDAQQQTVLSLSSTPPCMHQPSSAYSSRQVSTSSPACSENTAAAQPRRTTATAADSNDDELDFLLGLTSSATGLG